MNSLYFNKEILFQHSRAAIATFIAIMLLSLNAFPQSTISGTVFDADTNEPIAGANVLVPNATLGVATDRDGHFTITSSHSITELTFSFIGYKTTTIAVSGEDQYSVYLESSFVDGQPVIVSASRNAQRRSEAPVAISAISSKELAEIKPTMLYQALNLFAGVNMVDLGNEQHTMSIRQPINYKAFFLYLEDGIPIRPTGLFNHNALIEINMAGMERIEVLKGPSSSLYGSNGVGGAINFITPKPAAELTSSVSAQGNDLGYRRGDFSISGQSGDLGIYAGGYFAQRRDGWREHSDMDKISLTMRADYRFDELTTLVTTATTNHLDTDMTGSLDSSSYFGQEYSSLHTFTFRKVNATRVRSTLNRAWNSLQKTDATVFFRRNNIAQNPSYRVRENRAIPTEATGEENDNAFNSIGLNLQHLAFIPQLNGKVTAGLYLDRSPNTYESFFINVSRDPNSGIFTSYTATDSLLSNYDIDLLNTAFYGQFDFSPINRLNIVLGFRFDRMDYDFDNHLPPSAFTGAPDETNQFSQLSPKAGFTYEWQRGRGFYANYSRGFMPPEVTELYRGVSVPILESATFDNYEVGSWMSLFDNKVQLDVSLYQLEGENEIISVQLDDGSRINANAGQTRHRGIEYAIGVQANRSLSFRFSGTNAQHQFIQYADNRGNIFDGNDMNGAPGFIFNSALTYRPSFLRGLRLGLEWQHVDSYWMNEANTKEFKGYDLLNFRVGYAFQGVEFWANMFNLSDDLYAVNAQKTAWGESYSPGLPLSVTFGLGYQIGR